MIQVRGSIVFDRNLLPNIESLLLSHQWAVPKRTIGDSDGYPVYRELGDNYILIPRYSPLVTVLAPHRDLIKQCEPRDIDGTDRYSWNENRPLKAKQIPGATKAEEVLRKNRGCIVIGDTGSGKTVIGLWLAKQLAGRRTLILVDQLDLAQQWAERIREFIPNAEPQFILPKAEAKSIRAHVTRKLGPPRGNVNPTSFTIGTFQSMYASKEFTIENPVEAELLIVDETHVAAAPTFMNAVFKVNYGYSLGLTATFRRSDELEWIIQQCLGKEQVHFEGEVMDPIIYKLNAPSCGIKEREWRTAFCKRKIGLTSLVQCVDCSYYEDFPVDCGGRLPMTRTGSVKWGRLNRAAMITAWSNHPAYIRWCLDVVGSMIEKKRSVFLFGEGRRFLTTLYEHALRIWGAGQVGLFLGKTSGSDVVGSEYEHQRKTALNKRITFVTYGVARKALDVKQKDCAFFATPISDADQAAGRVRRVAVGKARPVVLVSVPAIPNAQAAWKKVEAQFKEKRWEIKESS